MKLSDIILNEELNVARRKLEKLAQNIESGNAPHDQQQKLVLEFYDRRLTKIEDNIEKLTNHD